MTVLRNSPYGNSNFRVEIDGISASQFLEVLLPDLALEITEYREGTDPTELSRKLVSRARIGNLLLRRGFRGEMELYQWWKASADGQGVRKNLAVILQDEARNDVARWVMAEAVPIRLSYSPMDGLDGSPLIETLELSVDRMELV